MDPRNGEILALANWPRVDAARPGDAPEYARQNRAVAASYEPGSTFKAFTVAGALEEELIQPDTTLRPAADAPGGRPRRSSESHDARRRDADASAQILAQSSNVGTVKIGLRLGPTALRQVGAPLRLRLADRRRPARRAAGHRAQARAVLGLVDRQPADRPGPRGHADADGGGLPGDRQRRRDAPAARRHGRRRRRPRRVISRRRRPTEVSRMLEGVLGAGRHRAGGRRSPATSSPARPARPRSPTRRAATRRPSSSRRSSASRPRATRACSWR